MTEWLRRQLQHEHHRVRCQGRHRAGRERQVLASAFVVGDTRARASWLNRLFFRIVLREHMAGKERQAVAVKASAAAWTLIQPVALVDKPILGQWTASNVGAIGASRLSSISTKAAARRPKCGCGPECVVG
jgi:hypothetical protein